MMRNVFILGFVSFLTDISSEMVYPLIPVLLMQLGSGPLLMGAIEGLAQSFGSLFKFYFGYASDRFSRRKPFLLFGYGIAAASKAFLALATTSGMVFTSRFVDRFGKGVRTAPRDALIAESAPVEKRGAAFGLHRALDTAGAVVGIGIAYMILTSSQGDIRSIFFWALVPGVLSILLLWFFVRDIPKTDSTTRKALPPLRWSMLPKPLRRFMLITVLFALGNSSTLFLLMKSLSIGFPQVAVLLLYLVFNIFQTMSAYPAAALSDKIGRRMLLIVGYLLFGLVYFGFAFSTSMLVYWALFAAYGLYMGLTEGIETAYIVDTISPELKATALGIHATLVGIMVLPASLLAGWAYQFISPSAPFYISSIVAFAAALGLYWVVPRNRVTT